MITITKQPYLCALSKNSIDFVVTTDLQYDTATVFPALELSFLAIPAIGSSYVLTFTNPESGKTETIDFVAVDGTSANNYKELWQIPGTGFSGSLADLRTIVFEKSRQRKALNAFYNIELPIIEFGASVKKFTLTAKQAISQLVFDYTTNQASTYISEVNSVAYHQPGVRDGYALNASLFLETNYNSGKFNFVTTIDLVLDENSTAHVDFGKYIDAEIEASWNEYPVPFEQELGYIAPNLRRYYVVFSENYSNNSIPFETKSETLLAHWGGVSSDDFYNSEPIAAQNTSGNWLTWWPSGKRILKEQSDWLAWMNGAEEVTFNVICTLTTNLGIKTKIVHENVTLQPFETYVFNTGYDANNLDAELEAGEIVGNWSFDLGFQCETCDYIIVNYTLEGEEPTSVIVDQNEDGNYYLQIEEQTYTIEKSGSQWIVSDGGVEMFVAVAYSGSGNRIMTSINGVDWVIRVSAADNSWSNITYGNGLFIAVAISGTNRIMKSTDGINWASLVAIQNNQWRSIAYGNGLFVTVSQDGTDRVMTSLDGTTWLNINCPSNTWFEVTYGNGLFVAVGVDSSIMTSVDGSVWISRTSPTSSAWRSVTYGNGLFVAVGNGAVMTSVDGITWISRTPANSIQYESVTFGNGLFVAVASSGGLNRVMTSINGIDWTSRNATTSNSWQSVTYGNGLFVAVSQDGTDRVMTSTNGIDWTSRIDAADNSWISVKFGGREYFGILSENTLCPFGTFTIPEGSIFSAFSVLPTNTCDLTNQASPSPFRYYFERACLTKQIVYFNSFGVPESFILSAEFQQNITTSQELATRTESYALNNLLPQNYIFDAKNVISYQAETMMLSNLEAERLMPLVNSTITFLLEKGNFIPVLINAGTTAIYKVNSFLQKIKVDLVRANESDRVSYFDVLPDFEPFYSSGILWLDLKRNGLNITDFGSIKAFFEGEEIKEFTYQSTQKYYIASGALIQEGIITFVLTCQVNDVETIVRKQYNYKWEQMDWVFYATPDNLLFRMDLRGAFADQPFRIDWGDGTSEDLEITNSITNYNHSYSEEGKYFIRVFKPSFSDLRYVKFLDKINYFDFAPFTGLEDLTLEFGSAGKYYFNGIKDLENIEIKRTTIEFLNLGFHRNLEVLTLDECVIESDVIDALLLELWTFRKGYLNAIAVTFTDLGYSPSAFATSIVNGTGVYAGDGLTDYSITVTFS